MEENMSPAQNQAQEQSLTKEEIAQEKKQKFLTLIKKIKTITLAVIFFLILIFVVRFIFLKTKSNYSTRPEPKLPENKEEVVIKEEPKSEEENTWDKFSSDKYKFSISYPKNDIFSLSEETNLIKIVYENTLPESNISWDTLVTGYYLTINPLEVSQRNISQAANLKIEWYKNNCPATAEFSKVADLIISDVPAKKFEIKNCNSDLNVIFVQKNNFLYEITTALKGDVGFKQKFESTVKQMVDSLDLYPEEKPPEDPYITFMDKTVGIYFRYPRYLNSTCCTIPFPVPNVKNFKTLIFLSQSDNNDTLGIFYDQNSEKTSFEDYIKNQANLLADDFKIIKGYSSSGNIEEFEINGSKVAKLSNYYWRGTDVYYIRSKTRYGVVIFSMTNFSQNLFDELLTTINFD